LPPGLKKGIETYQIKSVNRKADFRSRTMSGMIALLRSVALAAARVRMEKALSASEINKVASAEPDLRGMSGSAGNMDCRN